MRNVVIVEIINLQNQSDILILNDGYQLNLSFCTLRFCVVLLLSFFKKLAIRQYFNRFNKNEFMYLFYSICTLMATTSTVMVGYVWIRDIKNMKTHAANFTFESEENLEETELSEEIQAEYPNLLRKIA